MLSVILTDYIYYKKIAPPLLLKSNDSSEFIDEIEFYSLNF